jgi:hypothetical protein
MTTKELIIQELDQLPEPALLEVLEAVRLVSSKHAQRSVRPNVWEAYLESKREDEEVYRRLANS